MKTFGLIFLLLAFASFSEGYRILCLFPFNGKSHFVMFDALCKGLAKKGHRIDMISHFPTKVPPPNYTDLIDLNGTMKNVVDSFSVEYGKSLHRDIVYNIATTFGGRVCSLMEHEKMQQFIKNPPNDPPYDLVITEFFGSSCFIGFGAFLKVPVVLAISSLEPPNVDQFTGNPASYSIFPSIFMDNAEIDGFWDRLSNYVTNTVNIYLFNRYTADQTEMMRRYLGDDMPDVREAEKSASLVLVNSHHTLHGVRPLTPAIVEVGGLHVGADESKLTPELKAWLDSADHGLVYFTLGSLLKIETLPKHTLLDLYASFSKISPTKVLIRVGDKTKLPPGLPENVLTSPWIPQIPVLRHKNTRVFITHGGLMGSQEALYYGIPMIGIPVFADQTRNINIFRKKNMAILMNIDEITKTSMDAALDALLNDPKYRESAKKASRLFRDRPMSAMDTAIYWVEYVINNGPDTLKSPAVGMPCWKLHLLDVYGFLIACLAIAIYLLLIPVKFLVKKLRSAPVKKEKKKRN